MFDEGAIFYIKIWLLQSDVLHLKRQTTKTQTSQPMQLINCSLVVGLFALVVFLEYLID